MSSIKKIAEDLIRNSGGVYTPELLDTVPAELREASVSREALHALVAKREQKTQEFAEQIGVKSKEETYAALDFKKAEQMGCLAEAIRTKFFFNLAARVGVELRSQDENRVETMSSVKTVLNIAEDLVAKSQGIYTPELLDTIPAELIDANCNSETLMALKLTRDQKKSEFAVHIGARTIEEIDAVLDDFEKAKKTGCLAEAIRTKFFSNLAACVGVELRMQRQSDIAMEQKRTLN